MSELLAEAFLAVRLLHFLHVVLVGMVWLQALCGVLATMPLLLNFVSMTLEPCTKRDMPWVSA